MSNQVVVKVGVMPGKINEFAVEVGTSIADVLRMAELDAGGYDVKVDGTKVDPSTAYVTEGTSLILLAKQVKGNADVTIKVGVMPGKINEFVVDSSTTFAELLTLAQLDVEGYDVKADGTKIENLNTQIGSTSLVLLAKQVKGNADVTIKVGVMPGKINEFVVDSSTTFAELLTLAQLDADGYDVKADGTKIDNLNTQIGSTSLVLLAKQVKGNIA